MPKNKVTDPITDQEIAFARLILSGTMTDRNAAQAAGLNPDSAAYTKAKPHVRAYMRDHRAAVQQQLVQTEAETQHRFHLGRDQVLKRLWDIANMSPELTRNSVTAQVKALSMIVAMENLIPDRRAAPAENASAPEPPRPAIYKSLWLREQQAMDAEPQPDDTFAEQEDSSLHSEPGPSRAAEQAPPPDPGPTTNPSQPQSPAPYLPNVPRVPDASGPCFSGKSPFQRGR